MRLLIPIVPLVLCLATACGSSAGGGGAEAAALAGTYELDRGEAGCFLNTAAMDDARLRVQVSCFGGPPGNNSGGAEDTVAVRGGEAVVRMEYAGPCELRFRFHGDSAQVRQTGSDADCGFGNRVTADGIYRRVSREPDFVKYLPNAP